MIKVRELRELLRCQNQDQYLIIGITNGEHFIFYRLDAIANEAEADLFFSPEHQDVWGTEKSVVTLLTFEEPIILTKPYDDGETK